MEKNFYNDLQLKNELEQWKYNYGNNTNILYVIKQKMKKNTKLASLLHRFANEDNDGERLNIIEKILISLTDADNVKPDSKGKFINTQYVYVLEALDKQELISFSQKSNWHTYSEIELADIINKEFENLKVEMYAKLMHQLYSEKYFNIDKKSETKNFFEDTVSNKQNENYFFI